MAAHGKNGEAALQTAVFAYSPQVRTQQTLSGVLRGAGLDPSKLQKVIDPGLMERSAASCKA